MTRARQCLFLSCAHSRSIFGRTERNPPSRFLEDVPGVGLCEPERGGVQQPSQFEGERKTNLDLLDVDLDESDELVVDYSEEYSQVPPSSVRPEDPLGWVGQKVDHASFGLGMVTDTRTSSRGVKLVIEFDSVGRKVVYSNYVRLVTG
jgi:DNA helicase-2/ATP-dependent DNA helicase PcrA